MENYTWHNDWQGESNIKTGPHGTSAISRSVNLPSPTPHAFVIQQPTGVKAKLSYHHYHCWVRSRWDLFPNPPQKQCSNPRTFSSRPSSRIHPGHLGARQQRGTAWKLNESSDHKACTIRTCTVAMCTTEPFKFFWRLFGPDGTYHHSVLNTLRQEEKYEWSSVCARVYKRDCKTRPEAQTETQEGEKDRQKRLTETISCEDDQCLIQVNLHLPSKWSQINSTIL